MNTRHLKTGIASVLLWVVSAAALHAQSTAFTYQGSLSENGQPFSGPVEFQFTIWDAVTNGNQIAATDPEDTVVSITDGRCNVSLDFGPAAFDGDDRWLEIKVRTTIGEFTTLTPRQRVSAAPYALQARLVAAEGLASGTYSNAVTFSNPANVFIGNGSGLTGIHSLDAADGTPTEAVFVDADGKVGIGITSPQTALHVVGSILAGDTVNSVGSGTVGAVIAGGGQRGFGNSIGANANYSTISGGRGNTVPDDTLHTFIGGGQANAVRANYGVIGGGIGNGIRNSSFFSTIAGGWDNDIQIGSASSVISGGEDNLIGNDSFYATIPGGYSNYVGDPFAFAAGRRAKADHQGAFVWADSQDANSHSARNDQVRVRADGGAYFDLNNSHWVEFRRQSSLTLSARIPWISTGAYLSEGGSLVNSSDGARKEISAGGRAGRARSRRPAADCDVELPVGNRRHAARRANGAGFQGGVWRGKRKSPN